MESPSDVRPARSHHRLWIVAAIGAVVLLGVVGYCGSVFLADIITGPDFSDDQMVKTFADRRAAFDELGSLIDGEPGISGAVPSFPLGDECHGMPTGFSAESERRYEALRREIGAKTIGVSGGGADVTVKSFGMVSSGYTMGYIYADEPPSPLVADFDAYVEAQRGLDGTVFRKLSERWYAYLEVF